MYTVTGRVGGKRVIKFDCPSCAGPIESPIEEAGQHFPCPSCGKPFVTPGLPELEQQRDYFKAKEHARQAENARASSQAAEDAERRAKRSRMDEVHAAVAAESHVADKPAPVVAKLPELSNWRTVVSTLFIVFGFLGALGGAIGFAGHTETVFQQIAQQNEELKILHCGIALVFLGMLIRTNSHLRRIAVVLHAKS